MDFFTPLVFIRLTLYVCHMSASCVIFVRSISLITNLPICLRLRVNNASSFTLLLLLMVLFSRLCIVILWPPCLEQQSVAESIGLKVLSFCACLGSPLASVRSFCKALLCSTEVGRRSTAQRTNLDLGVFIRERDPLIERPCSRRTYCYNTSPPPPTTPTK